MLDLCHYSCVARLAYNHSTVCMNGLVMSWCVELQVYAIGNPFGLDHTLTQVRLFVLMACLGCSLMLYSS